MTTRVNVSSNVDDVIDDIGDVKRDIGAKIGKEMRDQMELFIAEIRQNIIADPDVSGQLLSTVELRSNPAGLSWEVSVGGSDAPYTPIVEYGSGERTNEPWSGSEHLSSKEKAKALEVPEFPFEAPDVDNMSGFAYYIAQWMREKGVDPQKGSIEASSKAIAAAIVSQGNYAHPFLRPAWTHHRWMLKYRTRQAFEEVVS